jgi:hypothetical protein
MLNLTCLPNEPVEALITVEKRYGPLRLKVTPIPGQNTIEVTVAMETREGRKNVIVDRRSVIDNTIEVSYPFEEQDGYLLVRLPRETVHGEWRVWVTPSSLKKVIKEIKTTHIYIDFVDAEQED